MLPLHQTSIRVLSLFDGLSTAQYVLRNRLGVKVQKFFSCEIDPDAIAVQQFHFFGDMIALGDVRKLTPELLHALGPIDVLLGGSPCEQLSLVIFKMCPCSFGR